MDSIKCEYPVCTVGPRELEVMGYDTTKITDQQIKQLGERMGERYLDKNYFRDLRRAADELGIPKKQKV